MTLFRFCRRRKDWLRQLRRLLQSGWKFDSADAPRLLIFSPAGASEITAHDTFHWQRFRFLYNHRTSGQLLAERLQLFRELLEIGRDKVTLDLVEPLEPECGNLVEHCALVRNGVGQDYVKSRDAIGRYEEERFAEVEDFAYLPAAQFLDSS